MSDFVMQIGADLDLSKVQEQLDSIKKQKVTLDVEIKGNDDAHNLAKSIEKGLKATKIDTSGLSKQLADAFNITDKSAIGKIKSQINSVMSELGKTWNGKEFNLQGGKGNAFVSGLSDLANSVAQNANIIQGKMGIYDQFYSYFKDKKIYVSDDLKKALSGDDYKELLNNNIGHIVRDASKGVSIDSIWGEMTSMFPEHFADNIVTQADQIKRAFEVLAQARQDMTRVISAENMTPDQAAGIKSDAFDNVIAMSNQIRERLQQNIETASEGVKNTYDLDVDINTEKIVSDIRNAIQSATGSEDAVKINVKINDEELLSQMKTAISQLATGDEPVQVDIQVNKQSLESDLEVALKDVELPIKFKIDSEQMAADIQAAVNQITDVEINLRVNTDSLRSSVEGAVNNGGSNAPTVDTSGMSELQNILNGLNNAGVQGQSVFQSFGSTLKDAFSTFTAANLLTDAIYKVGDAAKEAVSTVKELDDSIVGLQLATGKSYNTVSNMMKDYVNLGAELGTVGTAVAEGADAWLRQGKSIEEVNNLVKSSVIFSKVGDMSAEDATKYLTASLNGYQLEAENAMSVVDKISNVDLNAAVSSSGLAEAMSRVAVTADQAGISMDRLLGYVATIGEVTQQSTQAVLAQTMKEDLTEAQEQKKSDNKALKSAKTANKKASSAKKKADNKVKSTAKSLLKTNLTDEQKKQVQAGKKIDSTGMSGSQKKKADAYNKAVTNKTKANKKATSAKSKLSTAKSNYNSSNSTYNSMKSNVNEALNAYDSGDSLSYMNSLVDQQVSGKKLEQEARKAAVEQANANLTTTKKQKTTSDKKLAKLQKKYKSSKNLTAAQKKKIAAGKEIDTSGITDAKQLKILTAYNNALADSKKKKENVTIATDALAEANENLMTAEVESAQATVEAVSTKFDNAKTYYEALLSYQEQLSKYQEKNIDLAKTHGDYEKSSDYDVKISNTQAERAIKQNELNELTKQLDDGVEAGTIVENSQEWLDMQTKIKEAQNAVSDYDTQIEELKQQQIGVYYEEQFERAAEKVDRFRDKLDGLKSLISDDMKIDKNTGLLTESGALSITLDVDDINASTENLKTYIKERQQIINDYNAGKFGEDEYNQKLKDVDANIKSTTANIYSSRNSILELVKSQSQAELDVLNKVIDKRKEALSAKKNYYDYDKTLKNKTKDIEVLERQIAALEGSTSAEDKARKARLQEQLDSAKEELNDTIVDHAYSLQTDSLDKLSTDLSEDLDEWINKISSNMEEMTNAINGAISNAGLSTANTINAISSILRHYGLSDTEISQSGLTDGIKGYASGTNYVPKDGVYRVNEEGMESVFSKQYGTLTFLNQGDKVFDANFTKKLLDNSTIATQKNMPDYAGMAKAIEKNIQNIQNLSGNTYVNNFYIDGAQDTDSILKEIDKHLDKKIQAHDKKQVRDFKSLR